MEANSEIVKNNNLYKTLERYARFKSHLKSKSLLERIFGERSDTIKASRLRRLLEERGMQFSHSYLLEDPEEVSKRPLFDSEIRVGYDRGLVRMEKWSPMKLNFYGGGLDSLDSIGWGIFIDKEYKYVRDSNQQIVQTLSEVEANGLIERGYSVVKTEPITYSSQSCRQSSPMDWSYYDIEGTVFTLSHPDATEIKIEKAKLKPVNEDYYLIHGSPAI